MYGVLTTGVRTHTLVVAGVQPRMFLAALSMTAED